jgi:hypothetical protein
MQRRIERCDNKKRSYQGNSKCWMKLAKRVRGALWGSNNPPSTTLSLTANHQVHLGRIATQSEGKCRQFTGEFLTDFLRMTIAPLSLPLAMPLHRLLSTRNLERPPL